MFHHWIEIIFTAWFPWIFISTWLILWLLSWTDSLQNLANNRKILQTKCIWLHSVTSCSVMCLMGHQCAKKKHRGFLHFLEDCGTWNLVVLVRDVTLDFTEANLRELLAKRITYRSLRTKCLPFFNNAKPEGIIIHFLDICCWVKSVSSHIDATHVL